MRKRIYLLLVILTLYGCAGLKPPVTAPAPGSRLARGIKADAIVELEKGSTLRGRARILAKAPASFRIEVLGPFNITMALIISDGKSLYVVSGAREKEYLWQDPSFPYSFRAEDVVSSLLGEPPKTAGAVEKSDYAVSSGSDGNVRITRMKDGKPVLTVVMSDFRNVSGARLPFNVMIEDKREALKIKYSSVEIDPVFPPDSFVITPILSH